MLSLIWMTLAYIIGILWGLYLELNVLIITSIFLCVFLLMFKKNFKTQFIILCVICISGCLYTIATVERYDNRYINKQYMDLHIVITSKGVKQEYTNKYNCKSKTGDKFIVYFKNNIDEQFEIGDYLNVKGEFSLPDLARNAGGFSYRRYLNSNGFYGVIRVDSFQIVTKDFSFMNLVYCTQNYINNTFEKYLSTDFSGILSGMLIGETSNISNEVKSNFHDAGITHLLAVSGSNVAVVILFSNYLVVKLFGKKYSGYISIIFIIFFICISGASPSVVRAGMMAILNLLANILSKRNDSINCLISSSFFILIYNPLSVINVGFLLSFAGTIGIITFSKTIKEWMNSYLKIDAIAEILSLNLSAQIMIFPIMLYCFNSFSLVGIFTNLLIIPVTSFLTFLGITLLFSSMISFHISKIISYMINLISNYIVFITRKLSKWEFFNIILPTPKIWMIVIFYIIIFGAYEILNMKKQNFLVKVSEAKTNFIKIKYLKISCGVVSIFVILLVVSKIIPKNYTELTTIDVGQGDSFLIVTEKGKRILIDGGGSETSDYDVGENILMPYLLDRGFKKIDYIFVSHAHADHIDGIYTVLENFKVDKLFISTQIENDEKIRMLRMFALENKVEIIEIFEGDKLKIEDLEFEILYPSRSVYNENINNLSVIMKLKCNGREILFTGDAEKEVEEYLVRKYSLDLDVDILKVSHHGAKTSSTEEFIEATSPSLAIVSVAKENKYGHPNYDVLKRLQKFR